MELHENHEGDGGQEFSSVEEAREALQNEQVDQAAEDDSNLSTPTEMQQGGVSGGGDNASGTTAGSLPGNSGEALDGGSLPGNSGDAAN